jgi:hypothetical protein
MFLILIVCILSCLCFETDTWYQYLLGWLENPLSQICLDSCKKNSLRRPTVLCIKNIFGGISPLRQYTILVSISKDTMCVLSQESETTQGLVFLGVWILRQYK